MSLVFVYILKSRVTEKLYIGSTADVEDRVKRHNQGRSRYTKSGIPWELMYYEGCDSRAEAVRREKQLKSWKNKARLEKLIQTGGIQIVSDNGFAKESSVRQ